MLESRDESVNMEPVFWTQVEEAGGVHSWEPLFLERIEGTELGMARCLCLVWEKEPSNSLPKSRPSQ